MTNVDQLKELLTVNNITFKEIIKNETEFEKIHNDFSQTTLVVNDQGELWAVKLDNETQIAAMLNAISNFIQLKYLDLSYNNLENLPNELQKLTNLQTLNIAGNRLGSLPDWIQKLTNLQTLNTSYNNLGALPDWIQKLTNLQTLNIDGNNLGALPDGIQKLTNLRTLNIGRNNFQTLPPSLLPFLQKIHVPTYNVIIADVPKEVVTLGWAAIEQHYAEGDQKDLSLAELKVMIIGAGSSGKSCISKALEDNDYEHNDKEPSTVGIELREIKHTFQGVEWVLRMWDFGGQEAYAAAQTLFMTEQTLYIVVADGRTENRPDPYIHYINTFAPTSPIIIIINKIDENERADLNRPLYLDKRMYLDVHHGIIKFSCVENRKTHVDKLFKEIETVLLTKEYGLQVSWKPRWLAVKNDLSTVLTKEKYIDIRKYNEICDKHKLPQDVRETVRTLCKNRGEISSYKNEDSCPPIDCIMNPKWVTEGINYLFKLPHGGFYKTSNIYHHMEKQYSKDEATAILTMLKYENLAFEVPPSDNCPPGQFFIPALLQNEPSNFPQSHEYIEQIITDDRQPGKVMNNREFRFRYPFLHPIVKQTFMVKLYSVNNKINAYRNGVYWKHKGEGACVVMMEERDDLAFYLQGNSAKELQDVQTWIQNRMEDIHESKGIKNYELWHVFHTKDKNGNKRTKQYSNEDLHTFSEYRIEKIPLQGIQHGPSVTEILKDWTPPHNEKGQNTKGDTHNYYYAPHTEVRNSPNAKTNVGNQNMIDSQYSELQDFLNQFLATQNKSSENPVAEKEKIELTEKEIDDIREIIRTQTSQEGKKKFIDLITRYIPFVNAGVAGTNLLTAMINFSNAHPDMWTGVKAIFSFLAR
ncbi:MAG: leucine-rich repeat domain-containing protein [Nitrososphaerota archaeon]|jgi:small GTP-binding protein|nr:leucine-rich repeat domain-containing protein [Nitrososphaerota archaeon]